MLILHRQFQNRNWPSFNDNAIIVAEEVIGPGVIGELGKDVKYFI